MSDAQLLAYTAISAHTAPSSLPPTRPTLTDRVTAVLVKAHRSLVPIKEGPDSIFSAFSQILFNCSGHESDLRRQVIVCLTTDFASLLKAKPAKEMLPSSGSRLGRGICEG